MKMLIEIEKTNLKSLFLSLIGLTMLISVGIVLGFLFSSPTEDISLEQKTQRTPEVSSQLTTEIYTFSGITIVSELDSSAAEILTGFLNKALQEDFLPKEISLQLESTNTQDGKEYVGSWIAKERFFAVLYVAHPDLKTLNYLRTWTLPLEEVVGQASAESLLREVFQNNFLEEIGNVSCQQIQDPANEEPITACGNLRTMEDGTKHGVTVRMPLLLPQGERAILVSACFIPRARALSYPLALCL